MPWMAPCLDSIAELRDYVDSTLDAARAKAIARWPAHANLFARVKDDGRAEAALIGLAGIMKEKR